jgi:hypothetical protein
MRAVTGCVLVFLALLLTVPVAGATGGAPHDNSCLTDCAQQWVSDKNACQTTLNQTLNVIATELASCLASANGPAAAAHCYSTASRQRLQAVGVFGRCIAQANTTAWNCARHCQASGSAP